MLSWRKTWNWLAEVAKWLTHWGAVKQTTKILGSNRSWRSKITHFYGHLISKYDRKLGFNPMWIYVRMMNAHLVSVSQSLVDQMGSNGRNLAKSNPQQTNSCPESRRAIPSGSLLHGYGNSPFWSLVNHWTIGRFQLGASWSFGHGSGQDGQDPHGFATLRVFFLEDPRSQWWEWHQKLWWSNMAKPWHFYVTVHFHLNFRQSSNPGGFLWISPTEVNQKRQNLVGFCHWGTPIQRTMEIQKRKNPNFLCTHNIPLQTQTCRFIMFYAK